MVVRPLLTFKTNKMDTLNEPQSKPIRSRRLLSYLGFAMLGQSMGQIDDLVLNDGPPTKKINIYRKYEPDPNKQPRNAQCNCGSGKKYKHCCLRAESI